MAGAFFTSAKRVPTGGDGFSLSEDNWGEVEGRVFRILDWDNPQADWIRGGFRWASSNPSVQLLRLEGRLKETEFLQYHAVIKTIRHEEFLVCLLFSQSDPYSGSVVANDVELPMLPVARRFSICALGNGSFEILQLPRLQDMPVNMKLDQMGDGIEVILEQNISGDLSVERIKFFPATGLELA